MEQVEKDILIEIVKKGDSIELNEVQEGWEIIKTIQTKTRKFLEEISGYKSEIATLQVQLRILRKEMLGTQEQIKILNDKKSALNDELEVLQRHLDVKKIQYDAYTKQQAILNRRDKILPSALKSIDIYLKDGSTTKAKPAQKIFSEDLYKKYRVELKENHILKHRISELELEKKRLEIELRDFYTDLRLEEMGALDKESKKTNPNNPKNPQNPKATNKYKKPDIHNLNAQDLADLKQIIADASQDDLQKES